MPNGCNEVAGKFEQWVDVLWVGLLFARDTRTLIAKGKRLARRGAPPALVPVVATAGGLEEGYEVLLEHSDRRVRMYRETQDATAGMTEEEAGAIARALNAMKAGRYYARPIAAAANRQLGLPTAWAFRTKFDLSVTYWPAVERHDTGATRRAGQVRAAHRAAVELLQERRPVGRRCQRRVEGEAWRLLAARLKMNPAHLRELAYVRRAAVR